MLRSGSFKQRLASMSSAADPIESLFNKCDLNHSGYIEESEMAQVCPQLSSAEIHDLFIEMDKDGDGRISLSDFRDAFNLTENGGILFRNRKTSKVSGIQYSEETIRSFEKLENQLQDELIHFYQTLEESSVPHLIDEFQLIIGKVLKDFNQQQVEYERLATSYQREKENQQKFLSQIEEETEQQMKTIEARERERFQRERDELKKQMENEFEELQENFRNLQYLELKFNNSAAKVNEDGTRRDAVERTQMEALRKQMEQLEQQNRLLNSSLTQAQTNEVVLKTQMTRLQTDYEEKLRDLFSDRESVTEEDKMNGQIRLLQDANQKLQDTNDNLRFALDTNRRWSSASTVTATRRHTGVVRQATARSDRCGRGEMDEFEEGPFDDQYEDRDSGNSTMRETTDLVEADPKLKVHLQLTARKNASSFTCRVHNDSETESEHTFEMEEEQVPSRSKQSLRAADLPRHSSMPIIRPQSSPLSGRAGSRSSARMERSNAYDADWHESRSTRSSVRTRDSSLERRPKPTILRTPDRHFRVALVGDSAVGKTCLVMRICKGAFASGVSSTLSIDCQRKLLEVDNEVVDMQLWDTVGQERFRSIGKSYFRRADGFILVYDVTYERSFLSVREWMETINECSKRDVPIIVVGNKIDLRPAARLEGRTVINAKDGERLAKEYKALFIETSAKEGKNTEETLIELARLLRTSEEIETKGMMIIGVPESKSSCCKF